MVAGHVEGDGDDDAVGNDEDEKDAEGFEEDGVDLAQDGVDGLDGEGDEPDEDDDLEEIEVEGDEDVTVSEPRHDGRGEHDDGEDDAHAGGGFFALGGAKEDAESEVFGENVVVDEEGGNVVRVSKFSAFRESPFDSIQNVYRNGGMDGIISDTKEKAQLLTSKFEPELITFLLLFGLGIDISVAALTESVASKLKKFGIEINCWTCDLPENAERLCALGIDYITTNILE